jgi:hypothetical protein
MMQSTDSNDYDREHGSVGAIRTLSDGRIIRGWRPERHKEVLVRFLVSFLAAASLTLAADISGKWSIDGDVQGNPVNLNCASLQQDPDGKIQGKCVINGGDTVDISGEVKEDKIRLTFETGGYKLEYSGAVSGESMKGDIQVAGATGTFTGKRATP